MNDLAVEKRGSYLEGKRIALCVSSGIAAIETPKLARSLRRYGADVKAYISKEATKFIGVSALEWATEKPVVSELSGLAEHICQEDAVLVAPATLNTTNKIFLGLADNVITTLCASALGKKTPVYLAPTMHESMYNNPFFLERLESASRYGISIIPPRLDEGKAKIPYLENIVAQLCHDLSDDKIKGKRIMVTAGPTPVKIDAVRRITNVFKGTLGVLIAKEAYLRGAEATLLLGSTGTSVPQYLTTKYHHDYDEYLENVRSELDKGYDIGIFSAAVADYHLEQARAGKIPSGGSLHLELTPTKKVIDLVREKYPSLYMVTFKYEVGCTKEKLLDIARQRIDCGSQMVIANRDEEMKDTHRAYIVGKEGVLATPSSKKEIARTLIDLIGTNI